MPLAVMTGGTSGIGEIAADLLKKKGFRVVRGARQPRGTDDVALELGDLVSVRKFVASITSMLGGKKIDALILNAAINIPSDEQRTADGLESHFGINHLAHHVILRGLGPLVADGGRVIVTTADAHDPEVFKMAPPETAEVAALADPKPTPGRKEGAFKRGFRAYASSKLLNILMARGFEAQPETKARKIKTIYFNPGFTPGTKIGRNASPVVKALFATLVPVAKLVMPINTPKLGGETLAGLATGSIVAPKGRHYLSIVKKQVTWPDISALAANDAARDAAWTDSDDFAEAAQRARS